MSLVNEIFHQKILPKYALCSYLFVFLFNWTSVLPRRKRWFRVIELAQLHAIYNLLSGGQLRLKVNNQLALQGIHRFPTLNELVWR